MGRGEQLASCEKSN